MEERSGITVGYFPGGPWMVVSFESLVFSVVGKRKLMYTGIF